MRRRDEDPAGLAQVAALYVPEGRIQSAYMAAKLRIDPIHRAALALVPEKGRIVDLGCGAGQLALALALGSPARELTGLDGRWDSIERARRAAARAGLPRPPRFLVSDVRLAPLPRCQAALLIDVLHAMPPADQDALLRRASAALEPGGLLLVREVDRSAARWRYALSELEERLAGAIGWSAGSAGVWFRSIREISQVPESQGLSVAVQPMWGRTPYANALVVARKPGTRLR
jgi:SAM-dependent methyltransferase